jgi:hypothetical protein
LGSIWMFLAELFFMGIIFAGVWLLVRFVIKQTDAERIHPQAPDEFIPCLEKHQDSRASS